MRHTRRIEELDWDCAGGVGDSDSERYHGQIQAIDADFGRLLAALEALELDEETIVILASDNGVPLAVLQDPFPIGHGAKGQVSQAGVLVALLASGPGIGAGVVEADHPVALIDLYATLLEVAGVEVPTGSHSESLAPYFLDSDPEPVRDWAYSEWFWPNFDPQVAGLGPSMTQLAIRDEFYKYVRLNGTQEALYMIFQDPQHTEVPANLFENGPNLLATQYGQDFQGIRAALLAILDDSPFPEGGLEGICDDPFQRIGDSCTLDEDCCSRICSSQVCMNPPFPPAEPLCQQSLPLAD